MFHIRKIHDTIIFVDLNTVSFSGFLDGSPWNGYRYYLSEDYDGGWVEDWDGHDWQVVDGRILCGDGYC